jgi:hypothetical protein
MSRSKIIMLVFGCLALILTNAQAQYNWATLDGPHWADGKDVAYGQGGDEQDWHRYLIGSRENETRPFYWGAENANWFRATSPEDPLPANRVISYRTGDEGEIAFCCAFDDDIYRTIDGGENWVGIGDFDIVTNTKFSAIEIFDYEGYRGSVVFVGCQAVDDEPSAFKGQLVSGNW